MKAYYSRPIWGGPLLPIIPVGLFVAEAPMGCAPRTVAIIKFGVAAQDSIEVDWGDIVVVADGEPILDSVPGTWHFLSLTRQGDTLGLVSSRPCRASVGISNACSRQTRM